MIENTLSGANARQQRREWVAELERLVADAQEWSQERDWIVDRQSKSISEPSLGSYVAPSLKIRGPDAVLLLEPFARDVVGALGCVDFSVFPSFERVMVVLTEDGWKFAAPEKRGFRGIWSKRNFFRFADELARRR